MELNNSNDVVFFDIKKQTAAIRNELIDAITKVVDSGAYILGPEVQQFEQDFQQYFNSKYALGCASGSDALLLALMALNIGPGDEVLLPSFTYYATASCVQRVGATPVFVDSDASYNMNLDDLAQKFSPKTKVVLPVHLFGQMTNMDQVQKLIQKTARKIFVIEDCAQAIGAKFDNKYAGTVGDIGTFSFYPTKNLGGLGDGGMLTTNNKDIAEKLSVLRVHGEKKKYHHDILGINSRLDSIQATALRIKLKHLKEYEEKRNAIAEEYSRLFQLASVKDFVTTPTIADKCSHVWNQYTIRVKDRDRLLGFLKDKNIGTNVYYPLPLHLQKSFAYLGYRRGDLYMSERLSMEVLSLPIYPELDKSKIAIVVEAIVEFYKNA